MTTQWGFVTNHGRVLLCITQDPDVRLRDIAMRLGITERRAYDIVRSLSAAVDADRSLAPDIEAVAREVVKGSFAALLL